MVGFVFLLWMFAAILLFTDPKNEPTRWASLIAFLGGLGGFGVMLGDGPNRDEWILWTDIIATSLSHNMTPYAMWIFGLSFAEVFKSRNHKIFLKILFLIPVIFMYFVDQLYPVFKANYTILAIWTIPYIVGMDILLIYSTYRETRPVIRKNKIFTCLVIVPMSTCALITNIILEALGIPDIWLYKPLGIVLQFSFFAYLIIRHGFLDVRIVFEKQRRDSTLKAVTSGTALFNHTMKNEASKIDILVNELKEYIGQNGQAAENIELALNSTKHLLEISTRIQSKLDVMCLKESSFLLSENIEAAINLLQPYISSEIVIKRKYEVDVKVYADPIHVQETFVNIIKNAIEAMDNRGKISIKIYKNRRKLYVDITDTGKGIEKDKVFLVWNPFYSTKERKGNYGLGLTYAYNVMQEHGGDISIKSKVNQGTTFRLSLPSKRIIEVKHHS